VPKQYIINEKGILFLLISIQVLLFAIIVIQTISANTYRSNAMDLCAWHARRSHSEGVSSEAATRQWRDIIEGRAVCSFCGQKHNSDWISRSAWESQVTSLQMK